ncbi:bifunctional indole-3-glycerol-phosphate synthase TrpC/phosphoribosylanthranilate isomerase TrpF [Pleionea litopenaei]|uniref:Multifunctional fusion protein n=1 Tax=Pleionea litopenaei TaxID=3070815 RepID=A0AA51X708_9GAMM|nr:bifunctional indole-3-glycerol-phosphate synthase TrpC/phosphoribosylanthranilate isomerase TrpF [Pleionea sp. HL-JVS1]WMS87401.1 bifunctional indole-3-glycerol-phosphate synthase TrpC/phosphoribosylanthranilate isomerase TrpF [Pleionea sp. HL-JVS1]
MADKANVLQNIVKNTRQEVERRKQQCPLDTFQEKLTPSTRSLHDVMSAPGNRFILEYKRASPSRGIIRENFNPKDCFDAYKGCADAISVLTDEKYFSGKHEYLKEISELSSVPVLCKDFFIDTYQVYEARRFGADAILLMLSVLDDEQYRELALVAKSLSMDVLTEVHSDIESQRAVALGAKIIGINNRDLKTLTIDLATTERLAKTLPKDRLIISESGIETRSDVSRLASCVNGFLVGSSLMASKDVAKAAKKLVYGSVKICGITDSVSAEVAHQAGASFLGLMFYQPSKRYVSVATASEIAKSVAGNYVGVFVDESLDNIMATCRQVPLKAIQLHGHESQSFARELRRALSYEQQLWKALPLTSSDDVSVIVDWLETVDKVVVDYQTKDQQGGSGKRFDWRWLTKLFEVCDSKNIVIAGGINIDNVTDLLIYPEATIDLSSGVENQPGKKDPAKIQAFMNVCRMNGLVRK